MPTQISRTLGDFHFFMIVLPSYEVAEVVLKPAITDFQGRYA